MTDEQRELMRQAAQRVVDNHASGRVIAPETLAWAQHTARLVKPLGLPLSNGEPIANTEHKEQ